MNERDIFIAALQIDDDAQRVAYLDEACAGDLDLRNRVDALLGALHQEKPDEVSKWQAELERRKSEPQSPQPQAEDALAPDDNQSANPAARDGK